MTPVMTKNAKLKHTLGIPISVTIIVANDAIETTPLVAEKTI